VAVGVVGVPAGLALAGRLRLSPDPDFPSPTPEPTGPGNLRVPMMLRPTWLPDGMVELRREALWGALGQSRAWASTAAIEALRAGRPGRAALDGILITLDIHAETPTPTRASPYPTESPPASPPTRPPANATVGDRPAWLAEPPEGMGPARLEWYPRDGVLAALDVSTMGRAGDIARRVAGGLVVDTIGGCETALRFGWLPSLAGEVWDITVAGDGRGWVQSLMARPKKVIGFEPVWAQLATSRDRLPDIGQGDPLTLRGRPGSARVGAGFGEAAVELAGGRWLRVLCSLGQEGEHERDCAIRVANDLVIGPDPYLGWIGRR